MIRWPSGILVRPENKGFIVSRRTRNCKVHVFKRVTAEAPEMLVNKLLLLKQSVSYKINSK